ncbi:hypothetical protein UAY_00528 [Enterococcus moraviensis ATCC BAA-383]|uniref:Uncharacterized protein n=1 Tax=Enterococcus moraviensis ATCC BAA-383 TaxID=1158609 RepID=R2TIW6_9ENTE|nr:hypothetical protein UAY_00528 [Enterococcus moraviensis ATCC BAA-383]EOT63837.1 hypothetical protein I586_03270 [Enterococcus moraviensis ATCC BAA-383]
MYLLLVALGIISFIHSLLFVFIIQKNTDLINKITRLEQANFFLKSNGQRERVSKKEMRKPNQFNTERKTKPMKRGNRRR